MVLVFVSKNSLPNPRSWRFTFMFSLLRVFSFQFLCLGLWSFLTSVHSGGKGPTSLFCMGPSSYPSIVGWKDFPFPLNCPGILVKNQQTISEKVYFWTQFYSIDLHIYLNASTTLSQLLLLCSKFWDWEEEVLQLCTSLLRLFWLFCVPCISKWILVVYFSYLNLHSM